MNIIPRLEEQFKTRDDENPILFNIYDFVLALQRLGIEAFGADTIADYGGNDTLDTKFPRACHHFAVRSKVNGKWKCVMLVCVFGEWKKDGELAAYEIEEDKY